VQLILFLVGKVEYLYLQIVASRKTELFRSMLITFIFLYFAAVFARTIGNFCKSAD